MPGWGCCEINIINIQTQTHTNYQQNKKVYQSEKGKENTHSTREKLIRQYFPGFGGTVLVLFSEIAARGNAISTLHPRHGPDDGSLSVHPSTLAAVLSAGSSHPLRLKTRELFS